MNKKIAVITGVSSGIGLECAKSLLLKEWRVIGGSRREPLIADRGFSWCELDLAQQASIDKFCAFCAMQNGIDAVVSCAGTIIPEMEDANGQNKAEIIAENLQINLISHMLIGEKLSRIVAKQRGCFIWISSVAVNHYYEGLAPYAVAKAGLETYSRYLAVRLASQGVRSVSIRPGVVDTPLFQKSGIPVQVAAKLHPLGRIGNPDEIVKAVEYLISKEASWITGCEFTLDGGMTALHGYHSL